MTGFSDTLTAAQTCHDSARLASRCVYMPFCILGTKKGGLYYFSGNHQNYNFSAFPIAMDCGSYQRVSSFSYLFCIFSFVLNADLEAACCIMRLAFKAETARLQNNFENVPWRETYARRQRFQRLCFGRGPCWFSIRVVLVTGFQSMHWEKVGSIICIIFC